MLMVDRTAKPPFCYFQDTPSAKFNSSLTKSSVKPNLHGEGSQEGQERRRGRSRLDVDDGDAQIEPGHGKVDGLGAL